MSRPIMLGRTVPYRSPDTPDQLAVVADAHARIDDAWGSLRLALARVGLQPPEIAVIETQLDRICYAVSSYATVDTADADNYAERSLQELLAAHPATEGWDIPAEDLLTEDLPFGGPGHPTELVARSREADADA